MNSCVPVLPDKIDTPPSRSRVVPPVSFSICLFRSATFCIFHGLYHLPPCLVLVLARSRYPSYYRLSIVSSLYSNTSPDVLLAVCNLPFRMNEHDETIEPIWSAKWAALVTDRSTVASAKVHKLPSGPRLSS
jgi:hypothetical protein